MNLSSTVEAPGIDAILERQQISGFDAIGGTDKQTYHSYGPVYEALLKPLQNKECTILEVGVQLGGSLLLWHDFCPKSFVIGFDTQDIVHPTIWERMDPARYLFFCENAYSTQAIERVKEKAPEGLDFAIDDGPHSLESQCAFLQMYVPLLKKGGIAVVEDIQAESWFEPLIACVSDSFSVDMVDRRAIKGRYDDLMLIVRHD
jgi:cephalosporin hydroxylase